MMGNASLSDVDLTRTYRVVSTAALLTAPSAFAIWGNETVSKAQSTPYEGVLDAVERDVRHVYQALDARLDFDEGTVVGDAARRCF